MASGAQPSPGKVAQMLLYPSGARVNGGTEGEPSGLLGPHAPNGTEDGVRNANTFKESGC